MPCAGCGKARQNLVQSAKTFDIRGMAGAVTTAVAINVDKLRGMSPAEVDAKYAPRSSTLKPAEPYRRTR